jgi:integrase
MPRGSSCRLTNELVQKIEPPASGAVTWWDGDHKEAVRGFGIRVYSTGRRSWFLNYTVRGREGRKTLGEFPTWSATAARLEAKTLRQRVNTGEDPAIETRERAAAPTVQDLIDRYADDHLPRKAATGARLNDEKRMLEAIGKALVKHNKVEDVHSGDVEKMHRDITNSNGPVRANRVLSIASKMFSLSLKSRAGENRPWRDASLGNPCKGVERNREEAKERFFSQAELAAISDALAMYPGQVSADCVRLVMLTGCRPQEAMLAAWSQFEAEPGYWIKPSAHTKQRKAHKLPLSPPAIELLDRLRKSRAQDATWLFPGGADAKPIAALWHVWHFVRDQTGLGGDARLYDLRHSFASIGAGGGLSLPIIGRLLGHTQARTTQRYAHLADDPLREAAERIGAVIAGAGQGGRDGGKITSIKR